ncbi:tRNA-binding protein [Gillisia sp. Hel1_33_143]|uniref:tRNA-binding protein n=1 Tax=Gillisia sp. Hel1_33_143 TaxID=1336796 RepID=UPI000879D6E4|nr:tRNA-binding protein [Gillisia sp. Hel1_33_143]SDS25287.1 tRNA-binding protein [Gillisia sp. Hel1_33_143]
MEINWNDFEKVEMRVGTIISAEVFHKAKKPAYILKIDFGDELGMKRSSAQITTRYTISDLEGKQIIAVVNFPKKQIANIMSECLVLGAVGPNNDIVLLNPDHKVENGLRVG